MRRLSLALDVPGVGEGGALPFSDTFTREDGDLGGGWLYSAGIWTIASNAAKANPSFTEGDIVANGNMEAGDPPTSWPAAFSATLSSVADERTGGAGTKSLNGARGTLDTVATQVKTPTAGGIYQVTAYAKNIDATQVAIFFDNGDVRSSNASWTFLGITTPVDLAAETIQLAVVGTAGQQGRFDDVVCKRVTLADCIASRNVGSPHARIGAYITQSQRHAVGLVVGLDSAVAPANFVVASCLGTRVVVDQYVAGTLSRRGIITIAAAPSNTLLALEKAGNIVRVFYADVQIGIDYAVTAAAIVNSTLVGIFNTHIDNIIDTAGGSPAQALSLNGDADAVFAVVTPAANLWTSSGADDWLGRPVLCDDGTNWIAIYRSATQHESTGTGKFHIRFSADEGANWTAEDTFIGGGAVTGAPFIKHGASTDVSDAIIFVAPNGDLLIHAYEGGAVATHGTYQYRSTAASGGAVWIDEGRIDTGECIGGQDYTIVGTTIYITVMEDADKNRAVPWTCAVYKSADNGTTWTKAGTVAASGSGDEAGIISTGGNGLLVVLRDISNAATYYATSGDLGATWTGLVAIPDMGIFQRPRLHALAGGIMMVGRDERGSNDQTTVWYTPDNGAHWCRKFHPDTSIYSDCAYCDVLEKADGNFYLLTYGGTTGTAVIRSAVFGIT